MRPQDLLNAAGIKNRQTRFPSPPASTYAVWMDDIDHDDSPDMKNLLANHDVTIEMYEPQPDPQAEAKLEALMDDRAIRWAKQDRYWLQEEQRYQVVYSYSYLEKKPKEEETHV